MSRLEEIKKEIRSSGQLSSEKIIDQMARHIYHEEKLKNIPNAIIDMLKSKHNKKSS